uniref:transmembrane protein 177 n=1 Tax=Vespula vulgaris TaxID=7454 RepID=UPI00213531AF|nr:transmembrane protein 177 [Vespula vulgaris]XP_050869575.1 transmembrane protein 177 [Vespula vulgaris]
MYYRRRKFHLIFGISASITAYCVNLMPHTIFLDKLENTVAFYRRGVRLRINNKVKELCKEVMDDLKLPENTQSLIKPFYVFGFHPFQAGTLNKMFGGIIGIPSNFLFHDTADAAVEKLVINNKELDRMREEANDLFNSLVLSKNAQKYVIAREILKIMSNEVYLSAGSLSCIVIIMTSIYSNITHKFNLYEKKASYRRILYLFFTLVGCAFWVAFKDAVRCRIDATIDENISQLGLSYINGGKEYYEKELKKNIALRSLMEKDGEKCYHIDGNEKRWGFMSLPLSERKRFFESRHLKL